MDCRWICGKCPNFPPFIFPTACKNLIFLFIAPGCGDDDQLPGVSTNQQSGMDSVMVMGKEGSDMVHGGSTNHRARRLFQVQRQHTSLLPENSYCSRFAPGSALQSAVLQLLQGWCYGSLGTRSISCGLCIPGQCRSCWNIKQDGKTTYELHSAWSRSGLHLWTCTYCAFHSFPHT